MLTETFSYDMAWYFVISAGLTIAMISMVVKCKVLSPLWMFIAVLVATWCWSAHQDAVANGGIMPSSPPLSDKVAYMAYYGKMYRDMMYCVTIAFIAGCFSGIIAMAKKG